MYKFKTNINKDEYNKFVWQNNSNFMQEANWAKVKNNWQNIICGVYNNNKLIAACSILVKTLFKNLKMFYIPRGYVIDYKNEDILKFMTENIKILAKKNHAFVVKIDPYFCVSEKLFKNQNESFNYLSENYSIKNQNLLNLGYKHTGFYTDMHKTIQPRFQMAVPLIDKNNNKLSFDELLKTFKSKCRYYLGDYHTKRGVFFTHSYDKKDIKEFVKILKFTENNKNINLRNEHYFNLIMDNFKNRACLIFGKVNLKTYLQFLKNNNGSEQEITETKQLIKENGEIMTLSSALLLLPNTKDFRCSEYLYAGNDLRLNKLRISNGVALEACKISIENNCDYCNLGGVDGNLKDSLSIFKAKYNAIILEFAGEYDLVINKVIYSLYKNFNPLLKNIYKKKKK